MRWQRPGDIPALYAILDGDTLRRRKLDLIPAAVSLRDAGVRLLQYREKTLPLHEVQAHAAALAKAFRGTGTVLLLNDYVQLVQLCGFAGVHLGQGDVQVRQARAQLGRSAVIGLSTHRPEEVRAADGEEVDYIAIGPVFSTESKADAEPCVGLEGVAAARALTGGPLVAIGGIRAESAASVLQAGADSVAMIGELMGGGDAAEGPGARWTAVARTLGRRTA